MLNSRLELANYFTAKGYKTGVEVGVFDGYFSHYLLTNIPDLNLSCVDAWTTYPEYRDHRKQRSMDAAYQKTCDRLQGMNATIIKGFSTEVAQQFEDGLLDFVYIDANHDYDFVAADLRVWAPKVRIGGTVAGDDYYITPNGRTGVIRAVDEYVKRNGYELHITDWNMADSLEDNRQPSWYFTKTH